jgi:hypothetical protein
MILQDIYDQLSYGELRLTFLGEGTDDTDTTDKLDWKRLMPSMKLALSALHTRFILREATTTVPLEVAKQSYFMVEKDVLKIERVYGILDGKEYEIPLNVIGDANAVRTPTLNSLLIPSDTAAAPWLSETTELKVVYRQDHPEINMILANQAPMITEIDLPITHLEALLYHMASRITNPLGMTPGAMHEGNNFMQKYEMACQLLTDHGYEVDAGEENTRLERNGWV